MREIAVYEAKTRLSELLADIERGEQVTITRRGLPVARLVAVNAVRGPATIPQRKRVAGLFADLKQARRSVVLEGNPKQWAEDGRD